MATDLRSQIASGVLAVGAQLPSMTQIRATYGVSNTVVRDALGLLRREGLIVGQQGKGVFVLDSAGYDTTARGAGDVAVRVDDLAARLTQLDERVARLEGSRRSAPSEG